MTFVVVHRSRLLRVSPEPEPFDDVVQLIVGEIVLIIDSLELFLEMLECGIDDLLTIGINEVDDLDLNWSSVIHKSNFTNCRSRSCDLLLRLPSLHSRRSMS